MRLFLAIPLPKALKEGLAHFQARSRPLSDGASWPDPKGLHLTVVFLGEQEEAKVPDLMEATRDAAAGHGAFSLKTSVLGGFPKNSSARILWLGLEAQPALGALVEDLRGALKERAFAFDEKPFRPHLTLARFNPPLDIARFGAAPEPVEFQVREVVLYQSHLSPSGSRYEHLGAVQLS